MASVSGSRIPFGDRLTVRLTAAVIVALLLIGSPFLLAFHILRRSQQLEALAEATNGLSQIVVDSLRSAMLAGEPHLIDEAVRRIADQEQVERVILLDHRWQLRLSSGETAAGQVLDRETDPTCAVCHASGSDSPDSRTIVAQTEGRRVLRSMTAIRNDPQCTVCHAPVNPINGVLVMDFALGAADRRFFADIGRTVLLGAVMVLLTIAVLVWLLRSMVHRPLQAVVGASQRIVEGDLDAQAAVSGAGEFAQLASQVNRMTAHLSRSLRTVETQRRELQTILDAIDDEVVVLDSEQRIVTANEAFVTEFGRRGVDLTGQRCCDAAPPETTCANESSEGCPVQRVFETGQLQKGIVYRTNPDGEERVTEIHASPLRGPDGVVKRVVEVRRDISERRQMEAVVAQSERLASLGLLASGLSHEINNPLGAIATTVAGLRRRLPDQPGISPEAAEELERVFSRISQEVERGRIITHRLLKIARPPTSTRNLADVNHVVENILAILSHDISRSGIQTRLQLADLPPLLIDEARLGQVVMNLTLNAIQAMSDRGGELRIATSITNGVIQIEFEDTGCGIPASLLKRIFEPFFTTKPVGKGTGLGLFITHQIVSDLGGTVGVWSKPGERTSFTVRLPRGPRES
jgi:PAS domain S-box-containing protein